MGHVDAIINDPEYAPKHLLLYIVTSLVIIPIDLSN